MQLKLLVKISFPIQTIHPNQWKSTFLGNAINRSLESSSEKVNRRARKKNNVILKIAYCFNFFTMLKNTFWLH
jgi:hypothetical protein